MSACSQGLASSESHEGTKGRRPAGSQGRAHITIFLQVEGRAANEAGIKPREGMLKHHLGTLKAGLDCL